MSSTPAPPPVPANARWDTLALRAGAMVSLVFAVPFSVAARWAADSRDDSGLALLLSLGAVVGFVLGAGCAAWVQRLDLPLSHALVTAIGTYAVAQVVFIVIRLAPRPGRQLVRVVLQPVGGLGRRPHRWPARQASAGEGLPAIHGAFLMILVIDVGTTGLRASLVRPDATLGSVEYRPFAPESPFPGLVEFDATRLAELVLDAAHAVLHGAGDPTVAGVGITNQRASTVVWDRATGVPIAPALGWQDLRTVGECITAKAEHGLPLAPNQSATKIGWLLANAAAGRDPAELCFGTVDTWVAWTLSQGALHVTDHSNAAVTGLYAIEHGTLAHGRVRAARRARARCCPPSSTPPAWSARRPPCPGSPPIAALVGDQQASLVGQGCTTPGLAKITFGTGGMLDVCHGATGPADGARSANGTFPIVAWSIGGERTWGAEAIMLSAGTNVEWLRDDMGLIATRRRATTSPAAASTPTAWCTSPPCSGLGTPHWDYGARGTLLGLTRGTERPHVVRAVLEGVAHRGADLVEAAETDTGLDDPGAARRRRHEPQPHVRAGARRCVGQAGRGVTRRRGHDAGRRLPRRRRHGRVARPRRDLRAVAPERRRRARRAARPGPVGRGRDTRLGVDSRALGSGLLDCREMAFARPGAPRWAPASAERRHQSTNAA